MTPPRSTVLSHTKSTNWKPWLPVRTSPATRLGFGFKPEGFELGVVYEKTTDNLGAGQVNLNGHNAVYVSGKMNFGMSAVKLAYTKAGVLGKAQFRLPTAARARFPSATTTA